MDIEETYHNVEQEILVAERRLGILDSLLCQADVGQDLRDLVAERIRQIDHLAALRKQAYELNHTLDWREE